jgi:hypothetical protein
MRPLSVQELLTVWERGLTARPFERALAILATASPERTTASVAQITIGRCEASLLTLREWAFGSELAFIAACPGCRQSLETRVQVDDLRPRVEHAPETEASVVLGDYEVRCRLPSLSDLLTCSSEDAEAGGRQLFTSCVIDARHNATPIAGDHLPDDVRRATEARMASMDPQADMRVALTCPDCSYHWSELFDVASFFWAEIDMWARRLLRDVDALARVYGWTERDVLALSPVRRQLYLAMALA